MCQPPLVRRVATTPAFAFRTPKRRWAGSTPGSSMLHACSIPASTASRPELELVAETVDPHDHIVDRAGVYALAGEQTLNVPTTGGREQKMFGVDRGVTQHARLVIGQQDRVVCLVGKPAQRPLRPRDHDAGIFATAAAVTARGHERPPCFGVLLAGLRHARPDRALWPSVLSHASPCSGQTPRVRPYSGMTGPSQCPLLRPHGRAR